MRGAGNWKSPCCTWSFIQNMEDADLKKATFLTLCNHGTSASVFSPHFTDLKAVLCLTASQDTDFTNDVSFCM